MSQIQSFLESAGPGPGPILSLTGDFDVGNNPATPVGPNGAGNIYVLGTEVGTTGFAIVYGDPATNTLQVEPIIASVTTNDATTTTIYTLFVPDNTAVVVRALIIAVRDDFSATYGADWVSPVRRSGAGAVVGPAAAGSEPTDYVGNPPPASGIGFSPTQTLVRVRGTVGQTWNWTAQITYQFVV
jgi:hypothetical protein